jgi:hypothetical protein
MAKEVTYTGKMGSLQRFSLSLAANKAELQDFEPSRAKLEGMVNLTLDIAGRQAALQAEKQELSRQLKTQIIESERLANVMRKTLQAHYGIRAEKLAEFGLQPFRGRPRSVKTTPATPETPQTTPTQPTTQHPAAPATADTTK